MAIPGSPLDSRALGCNQLIREGAVLVQSPDEVAELLQSFTGTPRSRFRVGDDASAFDYAELADAEAGEGAEAIAALISTAPVSLDDLIQQTGASAAAVQLAVLELELAGDLIRDHAGLVRRAG
jgi:DNA processing protein